MNGRQQLSSPPRRDPLKSVMKSKSILSQSQRSNKAIDINRLLIRKQQSRESKINYYPIVYGRVHQDCIRHSDYPCNYRLSDLSNDDEEKYSTCANKVLIRNMNTLDQSFLSTNQNSSIIGLLLYLLFMGFICVEVVAISYLIPKSSSHGTFYFQTALLTILLSQLCYYLLLRYLSNQTKKKIFLHRSARASFDRLMHLSKSLNRQEEGSVISAMLLSRPYMLLGVIAATVVICQILYSILATKTIFLFEESSDGYMVSTLFWSNFALPYLFGNFYLNRPVQEMNSKVKLFLIVLCVYMLESLVQGWLFFTLMVFNLIQTYIHSKKEFDTFHINQLIKFLLLCVFLVWILIKYIYLADEGFFNGSVFTFITALLLNVSVLTISIFLTRVIANRYLKEELYRYFYTETGINFAFIGVAFLLNLMYLGEYHRQETHMVTAVVLNLVFLSVLGVIVYLQGKDKLIVVMEPAPFQQQNYY